MTAKRSRGRLLWRAQHVAEVADADDAAWLPLRPEAFEAMAERQGACPGRLARTACFWITADVDRESRRLACQVADAAMARLGRETAQTALPDGDAWPVSRRLLHVRLRLGRIARQCCGLHARLEHLRRHHGIEAFIGPDSFTHVRGREREAEIAAWIAAAAQGVRPPAWQDCQANGGALDLEGSEAGLPHAGNTDSRPEKRCLIATFGIPHPVAVIRRLWREGCRHFLLLREPGCGHWEDAGGIEGQLARQGIDARLEWVDVVPPSALSYSPLHALPAGRDPIGSESLAGVLCQLVPASHLRWLVAWLNGLRARLLECGRPGLVVISDHVSLTGGAALDLARQFGLPVHVHAHSARVLDALHGWPADCLAGCLVFVHTERQKRHWAAARDVRPILSRPGWLERMRTLRRCMGRFRHVFMRGRTRPVLGIMVTTGQDMFLPECDVVAMGAALARYLERHPGIERLVFRLRASEHHPRALACMLEEALPDRLLAAATWQSSGEVGVQAFFRSIDRFVALGCPTTGMLEARTAGLDPHVISTCFLKEELEGLE